MLRRFGWFMLMPALTGCGARPGRELEQAMRNCGLSPHELSMKVTDAGAFVLVARTPLGMPPTSRQVQCLDKWAHGNRAKLAFLAWQLGR